MTKTEAAARLGVSERTVSQLIHDGRMTYHRVGRLVRITDDDLTAFLNQAAVQAKPRKISIRRGA